MAAIAPQSQQRRWKLLPTHLRPQTPSSVPHAPRAVPRAQDLVFAKSRMWIRSPLACSKSGTRAVARRSRQTPRQTATKQARAQRSSRHTLTALFKQQQQQRQQHEQCASSISEVDRAPQEMPARSEADASASCNGVARPQGFDGLKYADSIAKEVASGARDLHGCPWIHPPNPAEAMDVMKPAVFIWAPEKLQLGYRLPCPSCGAATAQVGWARPRTAHGLSSQYVYVCARHQCCRCSASTAGAKKRVRKLRFFADHADSMAHVPTSMRRYWHFAHAGTTGQKMCEASVVDYIRAMATRTSWTAIADVINEMKEAAWARQVAKPYVSHAS